MHFLDELKNDVISSTKILALKDETISMMLRILEINGV